MSEGINGEGPRMDAATAEGVRSALLAWFRENARDLPWRKTRDPWRILVSEVMLQQIQVKRAIPFYEAFLRRFPTVEALAAAPLAEAIRVWGDLGRYRRVVNLHRTSRIVVDEYGGEIPRDPAKLVELPGIGPYTAGAVACFAFEQRAVFVDTNIRRVLHRLFLGPDVPARTANEREILDIASELVPEGEASWGWNQAIMELGALVCTARAPRCGECPLAEKCQARENIGTALADVPRVSKPADQRYEDSNRFLRGRVLAMLREAPGEGATLRELGVGVTEGSLEPRRVLEVARSLEKDGLAAVVEPGVAAASVVAEGRPTYGGAGATNGAQGEPDGEIRVKLP